MGCGNKTLKISSIIYNVVLALIGVFVLVVTAFYHNEKELYLAIAAGITGIVMLSLGVMGCFAAKRESVCLVTTCAIILLILALFEIGSNLFGEEEENDYQVLNKIWHDDEKMNALQIKHECCGRISSLDYILRNKPIPASCYSDRNVTNTDALYTTGCSLKLREYMHEESKEVSAVAWSLAAVHIAGFVLSILLCINFRNKQRRMNF